MSRALGRNSRGARRLNSSSAKAIASSTATGPVKGGEIDLVCDDDGTLVFVEVRARADARHGTPLETIVDAQAAAAHPRRRDLPPRRRRQSDARVPLRRRGDRRRTRTADHRARRGRVPSYLTFGQVGVGFCFGIARERDDRAAVGDPRSRPRRRSLLQMQSFLQQKGPACVGDGAREAFLAVRLGLGARSRCRAGTRRCRWRGRCRRRRPAC